MIASPQIDRERLAADVIRTLCVRGGKGWICLFVFLLYLGIGTVTGGEAAETNEQRTFILIVGTPGEEGYADAFNAWAANWHKAAEQAKANFVTFGVPAMIGVEKIRDSEIPDPNSDRERFKKFLADEPKESLNELWIVLIGHGTYNGREAKFNLRGSDFTATELADWLKPFRRPVIVINAASASAPYINALSAPNRVIVTSTRSGVEQNYARFGKYLSETIADVKSDLDKDGQVSLLEAYIFASKQTAEFYKSEGRLASEHPLLEDNADGYGTPADWFRGARATKKPAQGSSVDGVRAHQVHLIRSADEQKLSPEVRVKRDEIEQTVMKLRDQKAEMKEEDYFNKLENLFLELAKIYGIETNALPAKTEPAPATNNEKPPAP